MEERQNGQFGIKIKEEKDFFDYQKLINASFEDNNSQTLDIVIGRLTPQGLSFDTTYKGEEVYSIYNTKRVSDLIYEGQQLDGRGKKS